MRARYLEAPFTGSKPAAEQRKTVFFLGGDEALMAELDPCLRSFPPSVARSVQTVKHVP